MLTAWLMIALAGPPLYTCQVDPPCFRSVESVNELGGHACRMIEADILRTLHEFQRAKVGTRRDVCQVLHNVDLVVQAEQTVWVNENLGLVKGRYVWKSGLMQVARDMVALAHETLHAWEWHRSLKPLGESPGDWDKNRIYTRMLDAYEKHARPLDRGTWRIVW